MIYLWFFCIATGILIAFGRSLVSTDPSGDAIGRLAWYIYERTERLQEGFKEGVEAITKLKDTIKEYRRRQEQITAIESAFHNQAIVKLQRLEEDVRRGNEAAEENNEEITRALTHIENTLVQLSEVVARIPGPRIRQQRGRRTGGAPSGYSADRYPYPPHSSESESSSSSYRSASLSIPPTTTLFNDYSGNHSRHPDSPPESDADEESIVGSPRQNIPVINDLTLPLRPASEASGELGEPDQGNTNPEMIEVGTQINTFELSSNNSDSPTSSISELD
ncbi:hypothetical protein ACEPAF_402 [Sanghuangporus sanghuang]